MRNELDSNNNHSHRPDLSRLAVAQDGEGMMKFESKYDIGQEVWPIRDEVCRRNIVCGVCEQTGEIEVSGEKFICPKCSGKCLHSQYAGRKWWVDYSGFVGRISIEFYIEGYRDDDEHNNFRYMLSSTGIGSGQVWKENELFPSKEEAKEECDRRNSGINFEDDVLVAGKESP
ncbi:MAG TPA: hypothetical protein VLA12_20865 [Planctomycetaceae bacterium]|nr:hypothetical protein [Planctomycetaceae bacterium]